MSEAIETKPEISKEEHEQVMRALRDSLINSSFQQYHQFIQFLRSLPIPQQTFEMNSALYEIGQSILRIKDLLTIQPLILPSAPAPAVPEASPAEEKEAAVVNE